MGGRWETVGGREKKFHGMEYFHAVELFVAQGKTTTPPAGGA
jgi:hypothetical protein